MIRSGDFKIRVEETPAGVVVSVTHLPTGNRRSRIAEHSHGVAQTRDAVIDELKRLLYQPEDVRFDTGFSNNGDFIRVIHLPTGIERSAMRRESTHMQLLDEVLEEVFSRQRR